MPKYCNNQVAKFNAKNWTFLEHTMDIKADYQHVSRQSALLLHPLQKKLRVTKDFVFSANPLPPCRKNVHKNKKKRASFFPPPIDLHSS